MKKRKSISMFVGLSICLFSLLCFPSQALADYGLPVISIQGGTVSVEVIHNGDKETKYPGFNVTAFDAMDVSLLDQNNVEIKGRGNTTWVQPKKPYQIKFDKKQDLFGLGASKKWVLLANYLDPTFLRNDLAFSIARSVGIPGTTDGEFVWLYFGRNNQLGLYYLCHKTSVGTESLGLKNDYGVMFELDQPYLDEDIDFYSAAGDHFNLKDAVSDDPEVQLAAKAVFEEKWNQFDADARDKNWEAVLAEADVVSFAKYYLLSELSMNLDATLTSFFLHMDGADDVIHAGPAWDYDLCFNNLWKMYPTRMWCYKSLRNDSDMSSHILQELMDIPEFRSLVAEVWRLEFLPAINSALEEIPEKAEYIRSAVKADRAKWGGDDFDTAVAQLIDWTTSRTSTMDNWFSGMGTLEEGEYTFSIMGMNLSVEGLTPHASKLKLTRLDDGFYTIGSVDDSLFLTGGALPDEATGIPEARPRQYSNAQEWMPQVTSEGVRFFNKDSGLYLCIADGIFQERGADEGVCVFTYDASPGNELLVRAFVSRLYNCLLDRDVDLEGMGTWSRNLINGYPASNIVEGITRSQEFLGKQINDRDYVKMLYRALLDRDASENEVDIWTGVLDLGYSRKKLIEGVANSPEYFNLCDEYQIVAGNYKSNDILDVNSNYRRYIIRMYEQLLGRKWDEAGLRRWVQMMVDGASHQKVLLSFTASKEFADRGLSEDELVSVLFRAALMREPDESELALYKQNIRRLGIEMTIIFLNKEYGIVG